MKFQISLVTLAIAFSTFASTQKDLGKDGIELAQVLAQCASELKDAAGLGYVSQVIYSSPRPVSPGINTEIWEVNFSQGGFELGPQVEVVATLVATRKTDGFARVTYSCELNRR